MTRVRATALTLITPLALLVAAAPARADQVRLRGPVAVRGDAVTVSGTRVGGASADDLRLFAGRDVEVDVERASGVVRAIHSPRRVELRGAREAACDGAFRTDGARERLTLFGPAADLVPHDSAVVIDAWLFPGRAACGPEACVVGVEGRTTGTFTLVHAFSDWTSPVDVIRGERPVWLLARREGRYQVRRGDTKGWVAQASVVVGEPVAPGLAGSLSGR